MKNDDAHARGRPIEFDRDEALWVAMNCFWRNGYEGSPVTALSQAMGITRSSFYNSFGERSQLFVEALALYAQEAPDACLSQLEPGDPILPTFKAMLEDLCATRAKDREHKGCLIVNSIAELVGANEDLGTTIEHAVKQRVKHIERLLEAAQAQGEIDLRATPQAAALTIVTLICGINILAKVIYKQKDLREVAMLVFNAVVTLPSKGSR